MTNFGALPSGPQTAIKPNTCDNGSWMLLFLHVLRKHVGRACVANKDAPKRGLQVQARLRRRRR